MKKTYLVPETELMLVQTEANILLSGNKASSTGENVTVFDDEEWD